MQAVLDDSDQSFKVTLGVCVYQCVSYQLMEMIMNVVMSISSYAESSSRLCAVCTSGSFWKADMAYPNNTQDAR